MVTTFLPNHKPWNSIFISSIFLIYINLSIASKSKNEISDLINKNTTQASNNNSMNHRSKTPISSSCINALRFDTNSNNSFDEMVTINGLNSLSPSSNNLNNNNNNKPSTPTLRTKTPTKTTTSIKAHQITTSSINPSTAPNNRTTSNTDTELDNPSSRAQQQQSPPPPPSIIANSLPITTNASAPSPTKLPQFYPYTTSTSEHIMHRPIPILQKADAALESLINNLTSSSSLSHIRASPSSSSSSPQNLVEGQQRTKASRTYTKGSNNNNNSSSNSQQNSNKTPIQSSELNEFIKMNNQQQLISSLRSSMSNNSPLMFNMGFTNNQSNSYNGTANTGNANNGNNISFSNNSGANSVSYYQINHLFYF